MLQKCNIPGGRRRASLKPCARLRCSIHAEQHGFDRVVKSVSWATEKQSHPTPDPVQVWWEFSNDIPHFQPPITQTPWGGDRRSGALVLPIFFLVVGGIIEFGRAFMISQVLQNAAREGCRKAVTVPIPRPKLSLT